MATVSASVLNLRHLFWIRLLLSSTLGCALIYAYFGLNLSLNYPVLLSVFALFLASTVALAVRSSQYTGTQSIDTHTIATYPVTDAEYFVHILWDIALFSTVLYFSGGASNPFVSYYLVPLSISAAILPWGFTWAVAAITLSCYSLLLIYHQPIDALMPDQLSHINQHTENGHHPGPNLHIVGMWLNYLISTLVITYFVVKMAAALRHQQQDLVAKREDELRDQQIMAVATLAAGTAHELGTPLATMSILLKEMSINSTSKDPQLCKQQYKQQREDIQLLNQQVTRCKKILEKLTSTAETHSYKQVQSMPADIFIKQVVQNWQLLQPDTRYHLQLPDEPAPLIAAESSLEQAIINLLNNAARVVQEKIEIHAQWFEAEIKIQIIDDGPGIPKEIAEQIGKPFLRSKGGGLGLGLFLTHASIERLGGSITLSNSQQGGGCAEIILPITQSQKPTERSLQTSA